MFASLERGNHLNNSVMVLGYYYLTRQFDFLHVWLLIGTVAVVALSQLRQRSRRSVVQVLLRIAIRQHSCRAAARRS
jgi:hypothetical protein